MHKTKGNVMKKLKFAAMIFTVLSGLPMIGWYILPFKADSIGIISGAYGPTAIYAGTKLTPYAIVINLSN
jgi:Na+-transporting methylmalonyl-CoA/oxaloacetate decarboxylase beta subunit